MRETKIISEKFKDLSSFERTTHSWIPLFRSFFANATGPVSRLSGAKAGNNKAKTNNILKKNDLILTGAYGFPVPINEKKLVEVTSSVFGDVRAKFD